MPHNIDPRTSNTEGYFVMPIETLTDSSIDCIYSFQIAHYRKADGFSDAVYDAENMDESYKYYYATVPQFNEALYFTVETYYQEMIPNECTTGTY